MGPRQVTVFGASGFLGRHVVKRLAADGARIVAAVRDTEAAAFLRTMGDVGQIVPLACDIRNEALVTRALAGSDAAVNLVGILYEKGSNRFDAIHAGGPGIIARAAAAAGLRSLVHVSAIGADENAASAYASSKGRGEAAVRAAFPDAVILRPSIVFGPEDDFFNRFACLARLAPALPLFGGGKTRFQPVYVCDVAEAVARSLARHDARGRTFELGGPRVASFRELMEEILSVTGRRRGLVPLPMGLADVIGFFGDLGKVFGIPPQLTRDQAVLLRSDNVASSDGLAALGIRATAMDVVLPAYLDRFRRTGRFQSPRF
jgi:uncharacterized protein YbjT (DUF2867 family)